MWSAHNPACWMGEALPATFAYDLAVNGSGQVIVSSDEGLFISKTEGETWTRIGAGAYAVAALPDDHLLGTLVDRVFAAGRHHVRWDTAGLPPGAYVIRLQAAGFSASRIIIELPH